MNVETQFVRAMVGYALARAHTQRARGAAAKAAGARRRDELGASALEWAIISAILVAAALAIGLVVRGVIDKRTGEIQNG
jgi:Flp pilus assembly pilin Flp